MPGQRLKRMPWPSSTWENPRSANSSSMAWPSVWRWEFQQVEMARQLIMPRGQGLSQASCWRDACWAMIRQVGSRAWKAGGRRVR